MTIQQRVRAFLDAPDIAVQIQEQAGQIKAKTEETQILRSSLETLGDLLREEVVSVRSPLAMIEDLREQGYDSGMLQLLIDQIGWDTITSLSSGHDDEKQARDTSIKQSVRLFRYSPLVQWSIWLWTGWGLGDRVTVALDDKDAQAWWDEFATAERNEPVIAEDVIHELSDWLLAKGNRFIAFFVRTRGDNPGRVTARILDQDEIELVNNPEDGTEVWFYKRTFAKTTKAVSEPRTLYYPDYRTLLSGAVDRRWSALLKAGEVKNSDKRADKENSGTSVCVLHIAHNRKDERSAWGWPITTAAGPWVQAHKRFSEARLGVALAIAQFVRRTQVKGSSRAVSSLLGQVRSTITRLSSNETNPPGAAGSWHMENEASNTKELPMRTGAADAKSDHEMFTWHPLLGMGLFPTSAGLDTSRWATAVEMDKAQAMLVER